MKKHLLQINKIKKQLDFIQKENFKPALDGTHHKVFLSEKFVVRFRDDNPKLLLREADFLKQLKHTLIPKILWTGEINKSTTMIENRMPGQNINIVWKYLSESSQKNIIKQIIEFLKYLRTQKRDYFYSVNTGNKYKNFLDYLESNIQQKVSNIKKFDQAKQILEDILLIINDSVSRKIFSKKAGIIITHGDLIIHNLLTDGKKLTGVLDWELAQFGDHDYDLCRLFYYQECAKAYQEQGIDEAFESDYMDKLIAAILKSDLIKEKKTFYKKYQFIRAVFYLNALHWSASSRAPNKNIKELVSQWSGNKFKKI